jgi:phosphate transport system protein
MGKHLDRDIEALKKELLTIGALVEEATVKAISAMTHRRPDLAEEVVRGDSLIDTKEVGVETECMKILALHQPVAADLRFVVAVLKVNNDLERIGDLAANIARQARYLAGKECLGSTVDLTELGDQVRKMVRQSLEALVHQDAGLAREVCAMDEDVDSEHHRMILELQDLMMQDPSTIKRGTRTMAVSRSLERIADLATNIAEDVVFMVEGEVIRHGLGLQA